MPWGFAAAAAVGAVGSVVAGGEQASGQEAAANTQQNMFNTIVGQEQPFVNAGGSAATTLSQLTGGAPATGAGGAAAGTNLPGGYLTQTFDPTQAQLENYPGYQFQLQQGDLAVNSANSSGGSAASGPALKSLMSFNQGLAASNYSNYFNQFQTQQNNIFNRLNGIATMGQNAAGNLGTASTQLGQGIASAQAGAAGSIAGGIAGASNNVGQSILLSNLMNNSNGYPSIPQGEASPGAGAGTVDAGGGYTFSTGGS
jgi:hypothetical protein